MEKMPEKLKCVVRECGVKEVISQNQGWGHLPRYQQEFRRYRMKVILEWGCYLNLRQGIYQYQMHQRSMLERSSEDMF